MFSDWVIDVSLSCPPEVFCFVPIENAETANPTFVLGMNFLTSIKDFDRGNIRGFIHADGQEIVEKWMDEHPDIVAQVLYKIK